MFLHKASGVIDIRKPFFDVVVFHPNAKSYHHLQLPSAYRLQENNKQRAYDQIIREVEHGYFTPLVFSTSGGMGARATVMYKRLAYLLSIKREESSTVIACSGGSRGGRGAAGIYPPPRKVHKLF